MKIFKKDLDLPARRESLYRELASTEKALEQARIAAVQCAAEGGSPHALGDAEAKAWQAEFHRTTLSKAIEQVEAAILAVEEAERQKADRATREQTSRQLHLLADGLSKTLAPVPEALQGLLEAMGTVEHLQGPGARLPALLKSLIEEIPASVSGLIGELRDRAANTLAGSAPPRLPEVPKLEIVTPAAPGPTISVFTLQRLSWRDEQGAKQQCGNYQIIGLPAKVAKIALERRLAIEPDSDRCKEMRESARRFGWPDVLDPMKIYDLDRDPNTKVMIDHRTGRLFDQPPQAAPAIQAGLRGEPYKVFVSKPADPKPVSEEQF
jgi:hypothetical protein